MKRFYGLMMIILLLSLISVTACNAPSSTPAPSSSPEPAASTEVIEWDYCPGAAAAPDSSYYNYSREPLADMVSKATNGRLKITVHPELVPPAKTIDAVRDGTIQMGAQTVLFRGELALLNYLAMPFIPYEDLPEISEQMWPLFVDEMHDFDVELLGFGYFGRQKLFSAEPLPTLADLKNYKIRVHNDYLLGMLSAAGANAVFLPMPEVYTSLQRGVVNGAVCSYEGAYGNKFHEVCKYSGDWPMGNASFIWIVNKDAWASLPADIQDALIDFFHNEAELATYKGTDEDDIVIGEKLMAEGMSTYQADPKDIETYMSYASSITDTWKEHVGKRADEAMSIINKVLGTNY